MARQQPKDVKSRSYPHVQVRFSRETMESEKAEAFNNFALAYFDRARRGLPEGMTVEGTMDFYLSACSIEVGSAQPHSSHICVANARPSEGSLLCIISVTAFEASCHNNTSPGVQLYRVGPVMQDGLCLV